jgi:hypothetical protein
MYVLSDKRDMRVQLAIRKGLSAAHKDNQDKAVDRRVRVSHICRLVTYGLDQIESDQASCNSEEACNESREYDQSKELAPCPQRLHLIDEVVDEKQV